MLNRKYLIASISIGIVGSLGNGLPASAQEISLMVIHAAVISMIGFIAGTIFRISINSNDFDE
ncbi:hypothetical protein ACQ4M3_00960 [Leptolyngbya sp. AN03gr2]|uniref:hypothetical protein n=1 Tax=unclassified Leptolyngbya TaxID=2650499 RepID=UPI003D3140F0